MQKRILILIGVLLLMINIAFAATFSKTDFMKRINKILDKAATYTSITSTERAEYLKAADKYADTIEKCINAGEIDPNEAAEWKMAWNAIERTLDNPYSSASDKAQFIKKELKRKKYVEAKYLQIICSGGNYNISTNTASKTGGNYSPYPNSYEDGKSSNTTPRGGNYSPARKSYQCEKGQNIEGLCVYPLLTYTDSEDVAKRSCGNYNMTFATQDQVRMLSDHKDMVYTGHNTDFGSIYTNGAVWGINSQGKYHVVLCVKNNNSTTTTSGNYSPARKSYQCEKGQNIEGLCVYPLLTYTDSEDVAKRSCGNYNMTFATQDQVRMLSDHKDMVYTGHNTDFGSIYTNGAVWGINSQGKYHVVLCVKNNN